MDPKHTALLSFVVLIALAAVVSPGRGQSGNPDSKPATQSPALQFPIEPTGASRCQFCHAAEVEGYARSAMAHSLRRAGREPDGIVNAPDAKIEMHSSPTGYWQRLQSGEDIFNYRIDYVVGSGNHAEGYLLNLNGHLFQSPVAYYKSRHAYDLAPGYEGLRSPDFTRPIAEACLFCHAGSALKIPGTVNQYRPPVFSGEAISCERCHGSAEKHLSDPRAGTIVNPSKLEPAARDSICEQCHLLGVGRVLNPGMQFGDFRPGQRLEEIFTTYHDVPRSGTGDEKFKVISHVEQLARSTCSRMSSGRLWCGTCHDPHNKPLEPVQFFRSKCLSCHTTKFAPSHPSKQSNCISCHMPRRDAKDGGHTAFTDHRIQRRPEPESASESDTDIAAWREPAPELQKRNLGIAYVNAGMERRSAPFIIQGYRILTEVQKQFSNDSEIFTAMGTALLAGKQTSEAELAFERALQLDPNSVTGETNAASAYLQAGNSERATSHLERAIALDPLHLAAADPLIELYKQQGNTAKAAGLSDSLTAAIRGQSSQAESAEAPSPINSTQTAEAAFKNIQVLKSISSDQLIPTMRFISVSLGVECGYCHVPNAFDKDDKTPKRVARNMMRMMLAIDKNSFSGSRKVTCYSCHRGSTKPEATPIIVDEDQLQTTANAEKLSTNSPTADQLIDNYIQALGGAAAIESITSLEERGTTTTGGQSVHIEVFEQDPDKRTVVRHMPAGDATTVFNGREGWSFIPGHPVREMHGADLDAATVDADLHFPLHIWQLFNELRVEYPEKIGDHEAYVISCATVGKTPVKLYFDQQSGLLVRLVRYAASPLGTIPTQIDYADYRNIAGVQTPFRLTIAQADGISVTQFDDIQLNVPVNDARFAKPAPSSDSSSPSKQ